MAMAEFNYSDTQFHSAENKTRDKTRMGNQAPVPELRRPLL